jgi:aminomethyltransferase
MSGLTTPKGATVLRKTALHQAHRAMGAKMIEFNGWDLPIEYPRTGGLVAEHKAVRGGVGLFDVSHMGDVEVRGRSAGAALAAVEHITMNDVSRLAIGQAEYSAMLYPEGTFVDDLIVHRLGEDDFFLVINAGTREKDLAWIRENTAGFDCEVVDLSDTYTQLAIQGPRAADVLRKLGYAGTADLPTYWFARGRIGDLSDVLIARTGYTGEDGFEIYVPSDIKTSEDVWRRVLEAGREFGILPCGLGARNTLRLEARLPLYGHEISQDINVWEAGLGRFCKMEKGEFVGRNALERLKSTVARRLTGLEMIDRGIARDGYPCANQSGNVIGKVTSGSPSPTLGKNIALAYLPPEFTALGTVVYVEVRGQKPKARVVPTPFYRRRKSEESAGGEHHSGGKDDARKVSQGGE